MTSDSMLSAKLSMEKSGVSEGISFDLDEYALDENKFDVATCI